MDYFDLDVIDSIGSNVYVHHPKIGYAVLVSYQLDDAKHLHSSHTAEDHKSPHLPENEKKKQKTVEENCAKLQDKINLNGNLNK